MFWMLIVTQSWFPFPDTESRLILRAATQYATQADCQVAAGAALANMVIGPPYVATAVCVQAVQ